MKEHIQELLEQTVKTLIAAGHLPQEVEPRIQVDNTKDKAHGDLAQKKSRIITPYLLGSTRR